METNHYEQELERSRRKAIIKKVIFVLFMIVATIATVNQAVSEHLDSFTFNTSEIPINHTFEQNVSLTENATLFIERIDNESRLNVSYPNATFFGNDTMKTILFNPSVSSMLYQNTTMIATFNLSSDVSNVTTLYTIIAYAIYDNTLITLESEDFLTVQDADYYQNFTTDMLPLERTYKFQVAGPAGRYTNVSCDKDWLDCPDNATFGTDNKTTIPVKISLTVSFETGNHTGNINFTIGNLTRKAKIIIRMKKPDYTFEEYVFTDKCFEESKSGKLLVTYACMEEKAEFDHRQQLELIDKLKAEYQECNCTCEEPEIQYVLRGDIEEAIWTPYQTCIIDLDETRDQLSQCRDEEDTCTTERKACIKDLQEERDEYVECKEALMQNETICLANTFRNAVQREDQARQIRSSIIGTVIKIIITFVILTGGTVYMIYLYRTRKREVTLL